MLQDIDQQEEIPFRMTENFSPYKASWFTEFLYLFIRGMKNYFRNYRVILSDLFMAVVRNIKITYSQSIILHILYIYIYLF